MTDGSIVINVRNQNNYHCRCRIVVRSRDGGMTLPIDDLYFDTTLVDPAVAAGALQKDGVLYFTNPSNDQHSKTCSHFPFYTLPKKKKGAVILEPFWKSDL